MSSRQERREQLLDAAREVMLRYGYRKATLEDVAQQAGVSRATVYNYFSNKEELFRAIISQVVQRLREAVAADLDPTAPPDEQLLAFVRARERHIKQIKDFYVLTLNVGREMMPMAQGEIDRLQAQERSFVAGLLQHGVRTGRVRNVDPVRLSAALLSALRGLHEDYVFDSKEELEGAGSYLVEILLQGLLEPAAPASTEPMSSTEEP